jgi:hypothetical protein
MAQVVSRWLPTAAAWVRSCGFFGGQSGAGALSPANYHTNRFTLVIIHPICQILADVLSELSLTPTLRKKQDVEARRIVRRPRSHIF